MLGVLKILFGRGTKLSPKLAIEAFVVQMYPPEQVVKQVTHSQAGRGIRVDGEAIFTQAAGCCLVGLVSAIHHFRKQISDELGQTMLMRIAHDHAERYVGEDNPSTNADVLEKRIRESFTKLASLENFTSEGQLSVEKVAWAAAKLAQKEGEANVEDMRVFRSLIEQKYNDARAFLGILRRNRILG